MLSPDSPTVAVIIPVYNAVATLGRALDSVRAQTYPHVLETFVVDDGSEEGTEGLLRQHYPWVQYLRQEHSGVPGVARNRGVAASRADLLAFLDADDEWLPEKLSRQVELLRADEQAEFVLARCWQTTPDGGRRELPALSIPDGYPLVLAEWLTPAFRRGTPLSPTPSSWLLTRRLFDDLGGLDPAIPSGADWRFVTRALLAGRRVVLSVTPLLMYHNTLGSFGKSPRHDLEGQANRNIAFLEGLGPRAAGAAAPLDEATHRAIMFATCRVRVRELLVFGYLRGAARFAWRAWCCRVPLRQRLGLLPLLGLLAIPAALTRGQCRSWSYLARGLRRLRWNLRGRHTPPAGPP